MRDKQDGTVTVEVFQREDVIGSIPWVATVPTKFKHKCDGITSGAPLYLYWKMSRREDADPEYAEQMRVKREAAQEKYSCKKSAHWVYVLETGEIKKFCTDHLYARGVWHSEEEHHRFISWFEEHYQAIKSESQED